MEMGIISWIEQEFNTIPEPNIQDRIIALGMLIAELESQLTEMV